MLNIYKSKRQEIGQLFNDNNYELCLQKCFKLKKELKKNYKNLEQDDPWYVNFQISMVYVSLNKSHLLKKYADISSNYYIEEYQEVFTNIILIYYDFYNPNYLRQVALLQRLEIVEKYFIKTNQKTFLDHVLFARGIILNNLDIGDHTHQEILKGTRILMETMNRSFNKLL